jgi:uncharacterized protein YkwD
MAVAGSTCANANGQPGPDPRTHISTFESQTALRCLINKARKSRGLHTLSYNSKLYSAAKNHSASMDRHNYFSHYSRSGKSFITRIRETGYMNGTRSWEVGENLGWGYHITPQGMFNAWMSSSGHRATMLKSSFREIGIGTVWGSPTGNLEYGSATYTADFGRRRY